MITSVGREWGASKGFSPWASSSTHGIARRYPNGSYTHSLSYSPHAWRDTDSSLVLVELASSATRVQREVVRRNMTGTGVQESFLPCVELHIGQCWLEYVNKDKQNRNKQAEDNAQSLNMFSP